MVGNLSLHSLRLNAWLITGLWLACPVGAQTLTDPTRPPQQLKAPDAGSNVSAQAGLTAVVTAKEGVLALYNGETLRIGSVINDAKVVGITATAVFTRHANGTVERLPLYPKVSIEQIEALPAVKDQPSKPKGNKK